jgi:DNA-binding NtrC family response regulator
MRVLLVEDETGVRRIVARVLRDDLGHTVTETDSAEAAIHALHRGDFDVLITDVNLPGQDGCTLAANVRRAIPTMRVLLLSGYTMADLVAGHPECQAFPLLAKPFTPGQLRTTLDGMGLSA